MEHSASLRRLAAAAAPAAFQLSSSALTFWNVTSRVCRTLPAVALDPRFKTLSNISSWEHNAHPGVPCETTHVCIQVSTMPAESPGVPCGNSSNCGWLERRLAASRNALVLCMRSEKSIVRGPIHVTLHPLNDRLVGLDPSSICRADHADYSLASDDRVRKLLRTFRGLCTSTTSGGSHELAHLPN